MSPLVFSGSLRPGPRVRALSLALVGLFAVRGFAQEAGDEDIRVETAGQGPAYAVAPSTPGIAIAQEWSPPPELARQTRAAVAERWGIPPDSLHIEWQEPRRPLPSDSELQRLLGPGRAGSWIALFEHDESRGSIRFRAGVLVLTPVARIDFSRDHRLTVEDIGWAYTAVWGPPAELGVPVGAGWITRRAVAAGEPLIRPLVAPPPAVRSGEIVTVRWTTGRVTIDVTGEAVGEAAVGESMLVRLKTGLRVRGVVADSQTVVLPANGSAPGNGPSQRVAKRERP